LFFFANCLNIFFSWLSMSFRFSVTGINGGGQFDSLDL